MKRLYAIIAVVALLLVGSGAAYAQERATSNAAPVELQPSQLADSIALLNQKISKLEKRNKELL